jgi:hypothetical protein
MSQGWSTMYDLRMLNSNLLVRGHVYDTDEVIPED